MADVAVLLGKALRIDLQFTGVARYSLWEFIQTGMGSWKNKAIEEDGSSEDYRSDSFELDALAAGERRQRSSSSL